MAFFNKIFNALTNKKSITHPIFIKDFSNHKSNLNKLESLLDKVPKDKEKWLKRDIWFLKYGIQGEKNVYYELKNSFLPMLCLHDVRLEYNHYVAQFDFIIITNKFIYVLETKKLNGDIKITDKGDFIRKIKTKDGEVIKTEGMYSPITQNERHVNILKNILIKEGIIKTFPIKSAVVIANPKTIIDISKSAPKEIRNNIVKYDLINKFLKTELEDRNNKRDLPEAHMNKIAKFLIKNNKPIEFNYTAKYSIPNRKVNNVREGLEDRIRKSLKEYRLKMSQKEGIKAYMIFNNNEMELLIKAKPITKQGLLRVKGFGEKKVGKYGEDILRIFDSN